MYLHINAETHWSLAETCAVFEPGFFAKVLTQGFGGGLNLTKVQPTSHKKPNASRETLPVPRHSTEVPTPQLHATHPS